MEIFEGSTRETYSKAKTVMVLYVGTDILFLSPWMNGAITTNEVVIANIVTIPFYASRPGETFEGMPVTNCLNIVM
jgi:hypothetical protein